MTSKRNLSHPMPPYVGTADGWWRRHSSFATFSWPWWVRRGWIFWPVALIYGMGYASWHGFGMNALEDWPSLALVACSGALIMVSAGPLLATGVRYLPLPTWAERILVALALLAGLLCALLADAWINGYHNSLMARFAGHHMHRPTPWIFHAISGILSFSLNGSTLFLAMVGGGGAFLSYLGERRRLAAHAYRQELDGVKAERDAADLRLTVLQAQVEPHFLFNTLASVRSLIATDPGRAAATIDAMADYLRSTLPTFREGDRPEATLGKQIDICRRYLDLMNIRMDGRLTITVDATDAVRAAAFPPLILISLVENAVKHGIEPKPGPAHISIRARLADGRLSVAVEDDGTGLTPGPSAGLGLANVRAQLRNLYGDAARLDIASRPDGGTRAAIEVPTT